jgi:hypothetical protein
MHIELGSKVQLRGGNAVLCVRIFHLFPCPLFALCYNSRVAAAASSSSSSSSLAYIRTHVEFDGRAKAKRKEDGKQGI